MTFSDLSPGSLFHVPHDVSRSLLRRQWSVDRRGNGYNAVFVGGMLAGQPTWIEEDQEVMLSGEPKTNRQRTRRQQ